MVKIEDIMTKDILTVTPDTPISMAVKILTVRKVTGLPVVDKEKRLLGIITELDLLKLLKDHSNIEHKKVSEYMSTGAKYFSPDNSAEEVCDFLINNTFRRVPIVKDGKLVGIVSRADIISLIWREISKK